MKKILFAMFCIVVVVLATVPVAFAETLTLEGSSVPAVNSEDIPSMTEPTEEVPEEPTETISGDQTQPAPIENTYHTLFSRLYEYVIRYKSEIIGIGGDVVLFVGALLLRRIFKKRTSDVSGEINRLKKDTAATLALQESAVERINEMIDGYNAMKEAYEKYEGVEDDRNRLTAAVAAQNTALMDMLKTVYVNSKNLPQGVKDTVMLEYANARKMLGDDEILRAVVDSVHEKINAGESQNG